MIIVTGGAGFIGSNLVSRLNRFGRDDIIIVDDLSDSRKIKNISDLNFCDYIDYLDFLNVIENRDYFSKIDVIFHQGACSDTTVTDANYVMKVNFDYSKKMLKWAFNQESQFIYASSASVYGMGKNGFVESRECETPLNPYAFSKFLFDQYVRTKLSMQKSQIVGLRYFNVYGPREQHKGPMVSTVFQFNKQLKDNGKLKLFKGTDGYKDGDQKRDFIYVEDVVDVNKWFFENKKISGIFNVGTGVSRSFNDLANSITKFYQFGEKEYIDFPEKLIGKYQSFTKGSLVKLRSAGYKENFITLEEGVNRYLSYLNNSK